MKSKAVLVLCTGLLSLLTACNNAAPETPVSAPQPPAVESVVIQDACSLVTAEDIKALMGIDVDAGVTQNSSTCKFTHGIDSVILLQLLENTYDQYDPSLWPDVVELDDVGDMAFVQTPASNSANAQAVVKGKLVYFTFYSKTDFTTDQEKALLIRAVANVD